MSDKRRVTIRLSEEVLAQLQMLSDQRGESKSKIVRDLLTRYLERQY